MKTNQNEKGITLLITLLLMGVLLGIGASLLSITLKQYQLAGIAYSSEMAFQAANAGMECVLYYDFPKSTVSPFDVGETATDKTCMGVSDAVSGAVGTITSGEEQQYQFSWGAPEVCSEVSIYKYFSDSTSVSYTINGTNKTCPQNSSCTVVQARGYNVSCGEVNSGTNPRIVEREYTQVY